MKGLKDKGVVTLQCVDCSKSLLCLQLVGNNAESTVTKVVVKCNMCGGYSTVQEIIGPFYPGAPNDSMLFEIEEPSDDDPRADVMFSARQK